MLTVLVTGSAEDGYQTDHTAAEIYEAFPNVAFYSVTTQSVGVDALEQIEQKSFLQPIDAVKQGSWYSLLLVTDRDIPMVTEFSAESGSDPFTALGSE